MQAVPLPQAVMSRLVGGIREVSGKVCHTSLDYGNPRADLSSHLQVIVNTW